MTTHNDSGPLPRASQSTEKRKTNRLQRTWPRANRGPPDIRAEKGVARLWTIILDEDMNRVVWEVSDEGGKKIPAESLNPTAPFADTGGPEMDGWSMNRHG